MDEIPESPISSFPDGQIPDVVLPDLPSQVSCEQLLLVPLELPPTRSPSPTFRQPTIEEGNATTSSRLGSGSPANPILIDVDCQEGDFVSELGSAQCPILIEDRGALPRSDQIESKSVSRPSSVVEPRVENEPALLRGLEAVAQQQNGDHLREGSSAAQPPSLQNPGGQDGSTQPGVATDEECAEEDQDEMSLDHQAHDILRHRRAENGEVEYLVSALVRQTKDQGEEITKLLRWCREEMGKKRPLPGNPQRKKGAAPASRIRRSSRLKKSRQSRRQASSPRN